MNLYATSENDDTSVAAEETVSLLESFDQALYSVARDHNFKMCLVDHRGRRFVHDFYVDSAPAAGRLAIWGYSASGANNLVAWAKGKGRGWNGNRVRGGWGAKKAERFARMLNDAAAQWCAKHGAVPALRHNSSATKRRA